MPDTRKKGHRQRLRERFASGKEISRLEEALLELLLPYAIPRKDVQPLASRLISEFGSLSALLETPMETLCKSDGLKENSAVLLKLVDWIRQHHGPRKSVKDTAKTSTQDTLFEFTSHKAEQAASDIEKPRRVKVSSRRGTGMFGKAMLKEAVQILPNLPDTESLNEIRSFLRNNLHFSAEQTRQRNAAYIIRRMFPAGYADRSLRKFAQAFSYSQELRDACFYRFLKSEPLQVEIIEDLILTNLYNGSLNRDRIRNRLVEKFPESRSIKDCEKTIVDALAAAGIAKVDRKKISIAYQKIPVASFAFVLCSEFPEPSMYDTHKLDENRIFRAMLWNPEQFLHSLYELRNQGYISKVSEINNIRQFTAKHTLAGLAEPIVSGGKKP